MIVPCNFAVACGRCKSTNQDTKDKKFKTIKPHQEEFTIQFYVERLTATINSLNKSDSLKSNALTYFRRFYLKKSVMEYNPDYILASCLFLAFKISQYEINLEKMKSWFNIDEKVITEHEVLILTVMDYDLLVFCPYKARMGFLSLFKQNQYFTELMTSKAISFEQLMILSSSFIDATFKANALFTFSYSIIALAGLFSAMATLNVGLTDSEFFSVLGITKFDGIKQMINEIDSEVKNLTSPKEEEVKGVLKIIKKFKNLNPEYYNDLEKRTNEFFKKIDEFGRIFEDSRQILNTIPIELNIDTDAVKVLKTKRTREVLALDEVSDALQEMKEKKQI